MGCRCPADTGQEESQPVQRPLVQSPLAGIIVEFPLEACPKLSPSGHIVSYSCLSHAQARAVSLALTEFVVDIPPAAVPVEIIYVL